jgi:hypothetical protein
MPLPRYRLRPHALVWRPWLTTLPWWEQPGLHGRTLKPSANQLKLQMTRPPPPHLRPPTNHLPPRIPLMRPPLGNVPSMGGLTDYPAPLSGQLPLTHTHLRSTRARRPHVRGLLPFTWAPRPHTKRLLPLTHSHLLCLGLLRTHR